MLNYLPQHQRLQHASLLLSDEYLDIRCDCILCQNEVLKWKWKFLWFKIKLKEARLCCKNPPVLSAKIKKSCNREAYCLPTDLMSSETQQKVTNKRTSQQNTNCPLTAARKLDPTLDLCVSFISLISEASQTSTTLWAIYWCHITRLNLIFPLLTFLSILKRLLSNIYLKKQASSNHFYTNISIFSFIVSLSSCTIGAYTFYLTKCDLSQPAKSFYNIISHLTFLSCGSQ